MSNLIRPRVRLTRQQYEAARGEGYTDEEIAQEYDLPSAQSGARTATGVLGKFAQGISLGTADEIGGAVLAPFARGKTLFEKYRSARDILRGVTRDAEDSAPVMSTAAELAGAIAPAFVGAGTILPRAVGTGFRAAATRGAANVAEGAVTAAASSFGNAEGTLAERGRTVPRSLMMGGAVSAAVPGSAAIARSGKRALGTFTERGVQRVSDDLVGRAMTAMGREVDDVAPVVADKPITLMERMGNPGRRLARGARTTSPGASEMFDALSASRMPGTAQRVVDDLRSGMRVGDAGTGRAAQALDEARQQIGAAAFTPERMAAPVTSESAMATLLSSPVYRRAFNQWRGALAEMPGAAPPAPLFGRVEGSRQVTLLRDPTMADIEGIRQGLQDVLQSGGYVTRSTTLGPQVRNITKTQKRVWTDARNALMRDEGLAAEHPWYREALDELAARHAQGRALVAGGGLARQTPEEVADYLGTLGTDAEREAARLGMTNRIARRVMDSPPVSASRVVGGASRIPQRMDRLLAAAPNRGSAGRMVQRLGVEDEIAETERFLGHQSNTADKLQERDQLGAAVLNVLSRGKQGVVDLPLSWLNTRLQGNTGRVADEIARRFSSLSQTEQAAILEAARAEMARQAVRATTVRGVGRGAAGVAGGAAGRTQR